MTLSLGSYIIEIKNIFIFLGFLFFAIGWAIFFYRKDKSDNPSPNPIIKKYLKTPSSYKGIAIMQFFAITIIGAMMSQIYISFYYTKEIPPKNTLMIVLDISRSMLSEDILPSRIKIAKSTLEDFIIEQKDNDIGLIIFAGKAFTLINKSHDIIGINSIIRNITPDYILQHKQNLGGTNIGDALLLANHELEKIEGNKAIILITDGKSTVGIDPLQTLTKIKHNNIPIYTIGIGEKNNMPLFFTNKKGETEYFLDAQGNKIIGDLDDDLLKKISQETGGKYFGANSNTQLNTAFQETNKQLQNQKIKETKKITIDITLILCMTFLIVLIFDNFLRRKFYKRYGLLR